MHAQTWMYYLSNMYMDIGQALWDITTKINANIGIVSEEFHCILFVQCPYTFQQDGYR